ncbi:hypothetical protein [Nocardiopsis sp. NRRL B-16309]|uniref:hypothetical protein n=1 Tax=Nocardiopsis sp. NRRL B-16309 TaxID=1519494 RepID=UPI0012E2554A|nr:hypothetical protein [Nocardiopsis sp. NRRL B-16309]
MAAPDQKTAAEWLGITDRQLRRHLNNIQEKFGTETKNQAIILAALSGQLDPKALPANVSDLVRRSIPTRTESKAEKSAIIAAQRRPEGF